MGEFHIVLGDLDLKEGDKGVKKTFKVTGELDLGKGKTGQAKGEIELALAVPK